MKKLLLALVLVSVGEVMADVLPKGPYLQNCYYCTFENKLLKCRCHDVDGGRHDSSLIVNPAEKRPIVNSSGFLSFELPKGPYLQDCYYCKFDEKNVLKCRCHDVNGGRHDSSLIVNPEERRMISNQNGILTFFLPKGSYQRSCKDCTFDLSNLLTCSCSDGIYYQHPTSLTVTPEEKRNIINKNGDLQFDN